MLNAASFRDAGPDDAAALAGLFAASFTETFGHLYAPRDLAEFLAGNRVEEWRRELEDPEIAVQLASAEGALVGYAKLGPQKLPFEPRGPALELRQLYLASAWHGKGIAHQLMQWVLGEAARRGAEELFLSVYVDNERARRLYERYGFERVGRYDFMVGSHADEDIIMRAEL